MVAKHDAAQHSLMAQLKARRVKKTYLALVAGSVAAAVGRIEAPIGRDPKHRTRMAVVADGRPSTTGYRVRERFAGWTLLELDLVTGPDPPDPGPPRRDRPSGRGRSRLRHGHVAARARTASTGCSCTPGGSSSTSPGDGHLIRATAPLPGGARDGARRAARGGDGPSDSADRPVDRAAIEPGTSRTTRAGRTTSSTARPGAMLVIISGPSGVGKDTIIDALRRREAATAATDERHYVVTVHDARAAGRRGRRRRLPLRRPRRVPADARATRGFLEANEVHGNWYGSPRDQVREALVAGRDVILKIDVQGAQVVKEQVTEALLIFIIPPSLETLFERLRARATETADELELRQRNAAIELARQDDYDHVVVNETGQVGADGRARSSDHRRGAGGARGPAGPRLAST